MLHCNNIITNWAQLSQRFQCDTVTPEDKKGTDCQSIPGAVSHHTLNLPVSCQVRNQPQHPCSFLRSLFGSLVPGEYAKYAKETFEYVGIGVRSDTTQRHHSY